MEEYKNVSEIVKNATHELLTGPDWGANTSICDTINGDPASAGPFAQAVRKRLKEDKPGIVSLALTVLDALMKNCPSIRRHVASAEYERTIDLLLGGKEKKPAIFARKVKPEDRMLWQDIRERLLVMIQVWAKSLPQAEYPFYYDLYNRLRMEGVMFPVPTKDEVAPILTPPPHVPKESPPASLTTRFTYKNPDCIAVGENAKLLTELLTASSEKEDLKKNDLIQTLLTNVKTSQSRTVARLQSGAASDAPVLEELLQLNEQLLGAIKYYDGLVSGSMQRISAKSKAPASDSKREAAPSKPKHTKNKSSQAEPLEPPPESGAPQEPGASRRRKSSVGQLPAEKPQVTMDLLNLGSLSLDSFSAPAPTPAPANTNAAPAPKPAMASPFLFDAPPAQAPTVAKSSSQPKIQVVTDPDDPFLALALRK